MNIDKSAIDSRFNELARLISRISAQETTLRSYTTHFATLNKDTLLTFAEWTTSPHTNAVQALLDQINFLVTGSVQHGHIGQRSLFRHLEMFLKVNFLT